RKKVSLGVLPFGTGNDYNTVLGFPWSPKNAIVHLMEKSATSPVSIGKMKVVDTGLEKYFINVLDVGISSIVGPK
ncbi:MAG: diacylglycerol kinase family protein, partial [Candidatus Heimdallarchaeaceae archaeon]